MGTDINLWLEGKKPGSRRYTYIEEVEELYRSYDVFSYLFGVRGLNYGDALFGRRGVPVDTCEEILKELNQYGDGVYHDHSFFSVTEIDTVPFDDHHGGGIPLGSPSAANVPDGTYEVADGYLIIDEQIPVLTSDWVKLFRNMKYKFDSTEFEDVRAIVAFDS